MDTAQFSDDDPAGNPRAGALDRVISAGPTMEGRHPVFGSLRVRHFGPRALIEDASVQSRNTTLWNGEAGYRLSNKSRVVFEVFNIFDAEVSDIDYFTVPSSRSPKTVLKAYTHIPRFRDPHGSAFRCPSSFL